jgi:hypothetical protein
MLWLENRRPPFRGLQRGAGGPAPGVHRAAATIILGSVLITTATMMAYAPERGPMRTVSSETTPAASGDADPRRADKPLKVVGGVSDAAKPCEEQTWPYKDRHCLTAIDDKPKSERVDTAKLPADKPPSPPQPDQSSSQPVGSVTAIAPTPPVSTMTQSVGTTTDSRTVPILPSEIAKQQTATPATTGAASPQASAPPTQNVERPLSRREQRRLAREVRQFERAARSAPPAARTTSSTDGRAARDAHEEEIETIDLRKPHRKLGPLEPDDGAPTAATERRGFRGSTGASSRAPQRSRRVIVVD